MARTFHLKANRLVTYIGVNGRRIPGQYVSAGTDQVGVPGGIKIRLASGVVVDNILRRESPEQTNRWDAP